MAYGHPLKQVMPYCALRATYIRLAASHAVATRPSFFRLRSSLPGIPAQCPALDPLIPYALCNHTSKHAFSCHSIAFRCTAIPSSRNRLFPPFWTPSLSWHPPLPSLSAEVGSLRQKQHSRCAALRRSPCGRGCPWRHPRRGFAFAQASQLCRHHR